MLDNTPMVWYYILVQREWTKSKERGLYKMKIATLKKVSNISLVINSYWQLVYETQMIEREFAKTYLHGMVTGTLMANAITPGESRELIDYIDQVFSL
jgi:hypothetical protein